MIHICELCKYSEQDFLHNHCNVCCNNDRFEFDSGRFESEVREDERRKFAEWLVNKSAYTHIEYGKIGYQSDSDYCEMCWKTVDGVLAEYEKESRCMNE